MQSEKGKALQYREIAEDEHIVKLWEPLKFEITKDYDFVPDGIIFNVLSIALYCIALPILYVYNKIYYVLIASNTAYNI